MKTIHVLNYYGDLSVTGDYSADSTESVVVVRTENTTFNVKFYDSESHWYAVVFFEDSKLAAEGAVYGETGKKYEFNIEIYINKEFDQTAIGGMVIKKVA